MALFGDSRSPDGPGLVPIQDFRGGSEVGRSSHIGVRVVDRDDTFGDWIYDENAVGAVRLAVHWPREDSGIGTYSWIYTVGADGYVGRAGTKREGEAGAPRDMLARPMRSSTLFSDQYKSRRVSLPASWPELPKTTRGFVSAYATENREEVVYHHTDPRLIAANRGAVKMGSIVSDVSGDDFDPDNFARLQSMMRVLNHPGNAPGDTLGYHMGYSAQLDTRGGYFIDWASVGKSRGPTSGGSRGNLGGAAGIIPPGSRAAFDGGSRTISDLVPVYASSRNAFSTSNSNPQQTGTAILWTQNQTPVPSTPMGFQTVAVLAAGGNATAYAYNQASWAAYGGFGSAGGGGAGGVGTAGAATLGAQWPAYKGPKPGNAGGAGGGPSATNANGGAIWNFNHNFQPWTNSNFSGSGAFPAGTNGMGGAQMQVAAWINAKGDTIAFGAGGAKGNLGTTSVFGHNQTHGLQSTLVYGKQVKKEKSNSSTGQAIGMVSAKDGGPLEVGLQKDPHRVAIDADGNPINAMHLQTGALWFNRKATNEDGPMKFEATFKQGKDMAIEVRSHLAWNPGSGLFEWWSTTAIDQPDSPPTPEPPDPTEPKGPAPPLRTPTPPGPGTPGGGGGGGFDIPPRRGPASGGGRAWGGSTPTGRGGSDAIQHGYADGGNLPATWHPSGGVRPKRRRGEFDGYHDIRERRWSLVSARDLMGPSFSFMARQFSDGSRDTNYSIGNISGDTIRDIYDRAPATGHLEAFASQTDGDEFTYTQEPIRKSRASRWIGGTANGGPVFLPPELDMGASIGDQWDDLIAAGGVSTATFVMGPNTCLGFGKPDLATGGVTGTKMCHDDAGVVTITPPVGGSFPLDWGLRVLFAGEVQSDTTTVSTGANALLGDEFRSLKITGHWNGGAGDGSHLYVFFNGNTGTKVQITPTSWDIADDFESFELTLRPKSGVERAIDMVTNIRHDGDGTFLSSRVAEIEVWLNSADEITEIGLNTDDPNGIGAGSQFEVTGVRFL